MSPPFDDAAADALPAAPPRWGMVIDVNRCVGCQTCTAACKHANDTSPGMQWRRVLDLEFGSFPDVERMFLPVGCQHCDEPPCVPVCPTGATYRRADGIVAVNYEACIGCATCAVACPYEARSLVHERGYYFRDLDSVQEQAVAHPERLGVVQKCTFCLGKIDGAIARGRRPGEDFDATPACAVSCIAGAITFGDFNDPSSTVSRLVREHRSFAINEELGTRPMIRYLYETPAVPGRPPSAGDRDDARLSDPENPLAGSRQPWWDYRAAMNFILGGLASGLAVIAFLAHVLLGAPASLLAPAYVAAGVSMALGLTFVFFKIGRKSRFLYALRRPRTSWMSREVYAAGAFYAAVGASLLWPQPALHAAVALAAFAFVVCQARILFASKGIPAWRAPHLPWLIVGSALQEGWGALVLLTIALDVALPDWSAATMAGVALALYNGVLWQRYTATARGLGLPPRSRAALRLATPWIHLIAHAMPAVLAGLAAVAPVVPVNVLLSLAAESAILGGALWKYTVIVNAAYYHGLSLPALPQRGSGERAAPVRLPAREERALVPQQS